MEVSNILCKLLMPSWKSILPSKRISITRICVSQLWESLILFASIGEPGLELVGAFGRPALLGQEAVEGVDGGLVAGDLVAVGVG